MNIRDLITLGVIDAFVAFYCWRSYQHGMPRTYAVLWLLVFLAGVNLAFALGRKLATRKRPRK